MVSSNSDSQVLAKLGNLEEVKAFIESYKPSQTDCVVAIVDLSFKVSGVNTDYINAQIKLNMLTNREKDSLNCVFAKYTNDEIAETMDISKRSVENYLSRIYDKTGTNNKQQLLDYLEQN